MLPDLVKSVVGGGLPDEGFVPQITKAGPP